MEGVNLSPWRGFTGGRWQRTIDVRDFIIQNLTPYLGDETFLVGPSALTIEVWAKLQPYFQEEQRKGVLDVDAASPSTVLTHEAG
jgi:formate C-acetyltransferase